MKRHLLTGVLCIISCSVFAQHGDKPSIHGMLVFGKEAVYASHLPMFHSPHNYQIILELALDKSAKQAFVKDQENHPESATYTLEPERFVLPRMIDSPYSFTASVYRGHFERGGKKILENIKVNIKQVIFLRKLEMNQTPDTLSRFILFGNNKEQFAAHFISKAPDFEQIIRVDASQDAFRRKDKYAMVVLPGESNCPVGVSGNKVEVKMDTGSGSITLLKQLYLEFDDLKQ